MRRTPEVKTPHVEFRVIGISAFYLHCWRAPREHSKPPYHPQTDLDAFVD